MSGSRRFLLLLVVACVICVVLVQMTMDSKSTATEFFPPYRDSAHMKNIVHQNEKNSNSTSKPILSITSTKSFSITVQRTSKTTKKRITTHLPNKMPPAIKAKGQVRNLPFGRSLAQQPKLVNRQDRLQELIRQSNGVHKRPVLDPMRSLKSISLADPSTVKRIFVITYFRAGSSFFGDILQQNWKTFYHFEPLHSMTYDKRIDDEKIPKVFSLFNDIFNCNFTKQTAYIDWVRKPSNQFLFGHNLFLWVTCHGNPRTCFDPKFVNEVCVRAPVHVVKLTRLHMRQLSNYLQSKQTNNTKVVYLTRDPRGIVSSRWSLDWCNGTNCSDAGVLCHEMDEDISIFNELQKQQPSNFVKVRYEDLSLNPELETEKLFKFLQLPFSPSVRKFLKTHTVSRRNDDKNPYSTRRNSASMAFSWRERFTYNQITRVQAQCEDVLHKLNHSMITSPKELPYPNGRPKSKPTFKPPSNERKGISNLIEVKRNRSILLRHT